MAKTASANSKSSTLLLIDSHALIHRAYHAFPPDLRTAEGEVVNAVYGFARLLIDVITKFSPTHVVALMDAPGGTVRHDQFVGYKANRSAPDDDMIKQIPRIEELLAKFAIPMLKVPGYEADDLIGTIDSRHSGSWARTVIVTGDRDLFQLVDEDTFVYLAAGKFSDSKLYDASAVKEKMGVGPEYIVDLKGLYGDTSDNIPGVYGIGEKGAVGLVSKFGHIEEIFAKLDQVEPRYRTKLENNFEQAELSKRLATIIRDVPVSFDFDKDAAFGGFNLAELKQFFAQMQFSSLLNSIDKVAKLANISADVSEIQGGNMTLFGDTEVKAMPWQDGLDLGDDQIHVYADVDMAGDPLAWKLNKFIVAEQGNQTSQGNPAVNLYKVDVADMSQFVHKYHAAKWVTVFAKPLYHALRNLGINTELDLYDLSLSTYLLSGGQVKQEWAAMTGYYKLATGAEEVEANLLPMMYATEQEMLANNSDLSRVIELENKLIPIVAEMERAGMCVDLEKLEQFATKLNQELEATAAEIYRNVGHEFNIGSPKQVGEVLYGERGLPSVRKTKTGGFSTDERTLKELIGVDPVVGMILQYRELSKLLSTYLVPLPLLINSHTGHLHTVFNQLGAVTGRFSSQNPNLQNIPLNEVAGVNIRNAFTADSGSVLVAFDYSQQELRLLAELSGELNMQQAFRNGEDIHRRTAAEIFDIDLNVVTDEQRKIGKTVNFGVVYGISAFGLSDRLKIDPKKAAEFIKLYFQRYPEVKNYYDRLIADAKVSGYAVTILGRRRDAFGLTASNFQLRQAAEREIMNFPLQGSAADITKLAMLAVSGIIGAYPAQMILQVHDELIFRYNTELDLKDLVKDEKFIDFVRNVRQTMLGVHQFNVPLEVGVEAGYSWGEMQELEIN